MGLIHERAVVDRKSPATVLELSNVSAGYNGVPVLRDIDFGLRRGSVVAVVGANGAGKTTLMRAISGLIPVSAGQIVLNGSEISHMPAHERGDRGLCLIPEGRGIFRTLTVRDNLRLFSPTALRKHVDPSTVMEAFPVLGDRLNQLAGTLSGGEQQMLALARAYLMNPSVILFDELSIGLAPLLVDSIFESIGRLAATGVSLVVVEQYVRKVLSYADVAYILVRGSVAWAGPAGDVDEDLLAESYLALR